MKTAAFILGIIGLFTFASCRCNLEEDESEKNKTSETSDTTHDKMQSQESDTLNIR